MKVLIIGTDRSLFEKSSNTSKRIAEYGSLVDELHIIVFSLGKTVYNKQFQIAGNVWVYPTNSKNKLCYGFDTVKIAGKILKKNNKWLVTSQDPFETGLVAWVIARVYGAFLQLQIHTDFLSPHFAKSFLNKTRVCIAKFLLVKADGVRVVSERIKQSLYSTFHIPHSKISVLPIYTDILNIIDKKPQFNLCERYPQFKFIILMVGRLEKEKNYFLALEAFKEVVRKHPKTGLVIVGEGSKKEKLERMISRNSLQDNIILAGWREDVISYYKTADLFLHTSDYEGYCLVLIEAAAAGCPIVTTDVGVIGDFLNKDNTSVCEAGDTECIRKSIIIAMENKSLRARMSQDAQGAVLSQAQTKEKYLEDYKQQWEDCVK